MPEMQKRTNTMTDKEITEFRQYIAGLNASFDEWKMLISFMVNEAAKEHTHCAYMDDDGI
jgi:hypothetical protein